jgi:hypothetical protein
MSYFLVWIVLNGGFPTIEAVMQLEDKQTCRAVAKIYQARVDGKKSKGRFTCMKLRGGV